MFFFVCTLERANIRCFPFSDKTGAPHDVAKSHLSMYVNEVGHNMKLVENVEVSYC